MAVRPGLGGDPVAVSVGLALVLLTRPVTEATTRPTALLLPALGLFLGVAVALLAAATGRGIAVRAMAASVAAGILFGMAAATMKLAAARLVDAGPVGLLTSWPGYALALVTLASFALQQGAYAVGPLAEVMTAVIVIDPLVSYLLGVVGFGEPWPRPGVPLAVTLSGALVLVLGVATLVRSPLLRPAGAPAAVDPDRGRRRRREDEAGHRQQSGAS